MVGKMEAMVSGNLGWVKPKKVEELKGITEGSLKSKVKRKVLTNGVHYKVVDGSLMVHFERLDAFFEEAEI